MLESKQRLRVLDFDIENRPLSYWIPDQPTAEITAIASCWTDDLSSMQVDLLGEKSVEEIVDRFIERYNQADIVTGHYITRHDLPHINGALLEMGRPPLGAKMVSDTRTNMFKKQGVPATQEYLMEILGIEIGKEHMTQGDWREANRLTPKGLDRTRTRVTKDVIGHMMLRAKMAELGLLRPIKLWRP